MLLADFILFADPVTFADFTVQRLYMANPSVWETAWETAQPRIAAIRNNLNTNDSPDPRIVRVGQLDSELLDQELVHLLQEPLNMALSFVNVRRLSQVSILEY